jgi:ABC-type bacteriocin/lantibiotic exporter with double-glycine peptidase domain
LFLYFSEKFKTRINENENNSTDEKTILYFLDITTLQKSLSKLLVDFSGKLLQAFFGLLLLAIYHPLFLIFGGIVLLVVYSVIKLTWKRGFQTARLESNFKFETALDFLKLNREANNKVAISNQIDQHINHYATYRTSHFGIIYRQAWLGIITKVLFTAFMLVIGSYLLVEQSISLGQFLAAEILIITMLDAIEKLILTVENLYDCGIAAEKLDLISRNDD